VSRLAINETHSATRLSESTCDARS
jgi:hypothetical protein